jgi:hypothetical protein
MPPSSCPGPVAYHWLGIPTALELRDCLPPPFTLVPWEKPILELMS